MVDHQAMNPFNVRVAPIVLRRERQVKWELFHRRVIPVR
jgi:hypothetical protein